MTLSTQLFCIEPLVQDALDRGLPVVALESTVITHGLPKPQNLELALQLEQTVRAAGAQPATIGVVDGVLTVGLEPEQLSKLAEEPADKASLWNLAALCAQGANAGTTVATTLFAAQQAGIHVFATGGIGGVHHEAFDESADLHALARYQLVVVCAGAKSILNVAATQERLESLGVPVIGYQSDTLAGFHTPLTDLAVASRADSPSDVATCFAAQVALGLPQALLVSQPVHEGIDASLMRTWLDQAQQDAIEQQLAGKAVTPFLLARLAELSEGQTVNVNRQLLQYNAHLAAQIAVEIVLQNNHQSKASSEASDGLPTRQPQKLMLQGQS